MKKKLTRPAYSIRYPEDVARMKRSLERLGYTADDEVIAAAYEEYSDREYCAGWLSLLADDKYLDGVMRYLIEAGYMEEEE